MSDSYERVVGIAGENISYGDCVSIHSDGKLYKSSTNQNTLNYCHVSEVESDWEFYSEVDDPFHCLRIAYLQGRKIEYHLADGRWIPVPYPSFIGNIEDWRVKDE